MNEHEATRNPKKLPPGIWEPKNKCSNVLGGCGEGKKQQPSDEGGNRGGNRGGNLPLERNGSWMCRSHQRCTPDFSVERAEGQMHLEIHCLETPTRYHRLETFTLSWLPENEWTPKIMLYKMDLHKVVVLAVVIHNHRQEAATSRCGCGLPPPPGIFARQHVPKIKLNNLGLLKVVVLAAAVALIYRWLERNGSWLCRSHQRRPSNFSVERA